MSQWKLIYENFDPAHECLREALCTLGNGYIATRGAAEESQADDIHYPGTYLAGGYNRLISQVAGREISNEDLVNFPNWLSLSFRPAQGKSLNLNMVDILDYHQELDMKLALLTRRFRVLDKQGRQTRVESRRLVHMEHPHLAAIEYTITPENWSGTIHIDSGLDGSVINAGVARYRGLNSKHLNVLKCEQLMPDTISLLVETKQSHLRMAQVACTRLFIDGQLIVPETQTKYTPESITQELVFDMKEGQTVHLEKRVAIHSSRDRAISECHLDARLTIERCGRFASLLQDQERVWRNLWRRCDMRINGQRNEHRILRLHIFHLLQSVSPNSIERDVGVPARGLHGEAYRGHIFWDELFIFPFFTFQIPDITRSLLIYRYHRLNAARCYAEENGFQGAMYPWQSGSNGQEETQPIHLNPRSGEWGSDASHLQRHVNAAIVYNIWQYCTVSGDDAFLGFYGAEMILEIARFWSSASQFNVKTGRYEIHNVIGPDEYHEGYPGVDQPGLRNNAYTNVMAVWSLERAMDTINLLPPDRREELIEKLNLTDKGIERWRDISCKMTVPFQEEGIISQFEGYEDLEEFDWPGYLNKYGNIERLDRILKAEGDSPDNYKMSKQADVLMLFYLLPPKELHRIFEQLGYEFSDETIRKNVDYYLKRTSHGSTLSHVVHASVLDRIDRTAAWQLFCEALESDISDTQDGTTPEGIHLGAMAGTVDIVLRHYAGIDTSESVIAFHPRLPEQLSSFYTRLIHHGQWYELEIGQNSFQLTVDEGPEETVKVNVNGELHELKLGSSNTFPCN